MIYWPTKVPAEVREFGLDWRPLLSKLGDPLIINSIWTKLAGDAAVVPGSGYIEDNEHETAALFSGGTANTRTIFRNTITLDNAQILAVDCVVKVRT